MTLRQDLLPFPLLEESPVRRIRASIERRGNALSLRFAAGGVIDEVCVPPSAQPVRAEGLWQHTCFEMFLRRPGDESYLELNFSPSGQWAAFAFEGYRSGMRPLKTEAPSIGASVGPEMIELLISVPLPPQTWEVGLCAIIEDVGGDMSYWALAHPSDKPDFHHPGSFALTLPGPAA